MFTNVQNMTYVVDTDWKTVKATYAVIIKDTSYLYSHIH